MSSNTNPDVRVLLVDDQRLIRDGIATLLNLQPGVTIIGEAGNGAEAYRAMLDLSPDVILMDIRMPEVDGIEATRNILAERPLVRIIMLTTFDDEEYIIRALHAGACGYLLKNLPAPELAQAIKSAHAGVFQLEPSIAGKLIGNFQQTQTGTLPTSTAKAQKPINTELTRRELEVLQCMAAGYTNREIAEQLTISPSTVKSHVSNILTRLNLRDRVQAVIYARERGWA